MRSRFMMLPVTALLIFAAAGDADAKGGKGFRGLWGGKASSDTASPNSSEKTAGLNPNRASEDRASYAVSPYRGGSHRVQLSAGGGYPTQPLSPSGYSRPRPTSPTSTSMMVGVPVFAPPASAATATAAPVSNEPAPAAKAAGSEGRVAAAGKKSHDINFCGNGFRYTHANGCEAIPR
jgi:hypothetical protein